MKSYLYLASPYSCTNPHATPSMVRQIVQQKYQVVMHATALLIQSGVVVYSPIVHCHPIAMRYKLPGDHEYWELFDKTMLANAERFGVLAVDGWEQSKGIRQELEIANELDKPISYFEFAQSGEQLIERAHPRKLDQELHGAHEEQRGA